MARHEHAAHHDHALTAPDGRELAATTFPGTSGDVAVVAGATGVPRRFYRDLAAAIRERGPTVLTFDYRGVGGSRHVHPRHEPARMRDWGHLDIEAALRRAEAHATGRVLWVGQSAGAVFLPLAASRHVATRILSVAGLSGYYGRMVPRERVRLWFGWHVVFPLALATVGYMPRRIWGGHDLPPGVMREWSGWCRHPDYFFGDPTLDATGYADITAPILAVRSTDDPWATHANHRAIHERFSAAPVEYRDLDPASLGVDRVGHIDLLRASVGGDAWPEMLDWLLSGA